MINEYIFRENDMLIYIFPPCPRSSGISSFFFLFFHTPTNTDWFSSMCLTINGMLPLPSLVNATATAGQRHQFRSKRRALLPSRSLPGLRRSALKGTCSLNIAAQVVYLWGGPKWYVLSLQGENVFSKEPLRPHVPIMFFTYLPGVEFGILAPFLTENRGKTYKV